MEIIIIGIIFFCIYYFFIKKNNDDDNETPDYTPKNTAHYRPKRYNNKNNNITWNNQNTITGSLPSKKEIEDLQDAFTGLKLDPKKGLNQCKICTVFYHNESFELLKSENNGKCVSCASINIVQLKGVGDSGRNYTPSSITLQNYKSFEGQVITFEGYVERILSGRRSTYAVMFENKSWVRGFKLVFFKGSTKRMGGENFVYSLNNRKIKVRGLLANHERYGWQIIISEKNMIMKIN